MRHILQVKATSICQENHFFFKEGFLKFRTKFPKSFGQKESSCGVILFMVRSYKNVMIFQPIISSNNVKNKNIFFQSRTLFNGIKRITR